MSNLELMKYWGSLYHEVDKEKFQQALKDNVKRYKLLPQSTYFGVKNRWSAESYSKFNNKTSAQEYLEEYDSEPPQANFDMMLVLKYALLSKPNTLVLEGDIIIDRWFKSKEYNPENGYYFFHGDVHIKGNLNFDMRIYITGNLVVDGVIQDTEEWSPLLVGGNIKAGGIEMGSQIFCAGKISTPLVCIDGTGELLVGEKLEAKLLTEEGYDHHINGRLNVQHHINFAEEEKQPLQELEKIIIPEIIIKLKKESKKTAKELGDTEEDNTFYFDKSILFDYIRKGENIWK